MTKSRAWLTAASIVFTTPFFIGTHVAADSGQGAFHADLEGVQETPSISTAATGQFQAKLDPAGTHLDYELRYSGLEGGNTLFAHVHIGQAGVAGGVMFFLCGGGGKPACPNGDATVTGVVTAANVIGPTAQGISAGEFGEVIRAMQLGIAYANVHTISFPAGEIRGQIK